MFFFGVAFLLAVLNGCAGLKQTQDTPYKIQNKKEILVARDIGRGGAIYLIRWCGKSGLVYRIVETREVELLDFRTGKRTPVDIDMQETHLNCTPDGKKLFYLPDEKRTSDDGSVEWYRGSGDMYMYDTVTGEKTFVARTRGSGSYDAVSPDGTKILLGARHELASYSGAPGMEGVWFTEEWKPTEAAWFPDSSGVLAYGTHRGDQICIEIFGEDGWAKCFNMVDIDSSTHEPRADSKNRVYFLDVEFDFMTEWETNYLHRCDLRDGELSCERIIKDHDVFPTYGFLPDGDIVFGEYKKGDCIRRITPGQETSRCEIYPRYGESVYRNVSLRGISPGGQWLVFSRSNSKGWKKRADGMGSDLWQGQIDMFVIDLMEE